MVTNEELFRSLRAVLSHIKDVQQEVAKHSKDSMLAIGAFLEEKKVEISPEVLKAIQAQDIYSQQLGAAVEAIDSIEKYLDYYLRSLQEDSGMLAENFSKLSGKLNESLDRAKDRHQAFRGQIMATEDEGEIDFF